MKMFLALFAFAVLAAFLALLALRVPSPDLLAVIALTVVLVAVDFVSAIRRRR